MKYKRTDLIASWTHKFYQQIIKHLWMLFVWSSTVLFCTSEIKDEHYRKGLGFFFRRGSYRNMLRCSLRNHETSINLILAFLFRPFGLYCSQRFQNYFSNLRVPDEGDFRNASGALNLISAFLFGVYMIIVKSTICYIWTS